MSLLHLHLYIYYILYINNIVYHSCLCYNTAKQNGSNVRKKKKKIFRLYTLGL